MLLRQFAKGYNRKYHSPAEVSFVTDQGSICSWRGDNETRFEVAFRVNIYLFILLLSVNVGFVTKKKKGSVQQSFGEWKIFAYIYFIYDNEYHLHAQVN